MASSSSSKTTYDVFLSFRGVDTRDSFLSHLYQKLVDKNIQTFIDDRLDRGEKIEPSLMKVIEESQISVIIFSLGYASSPWCLDELVKILECRERMGRILLPIFYHVDPSDVEKQTGIFGDGFKKLQSYHKESINKWRNALIEVATLSGWDWSNHRPDSKLIEEVIKDIVNKISPTSYNISTDLVGVDSQIEQILSLLYAGADDKPRFIGLWGMGGIGKTTIAEALFSLISDQFDCCCFLSNVRENSSKHGLIHLKRQLLSELSWDKNLNIQMLNVLPTFVMNRLKRNKVIIVLDDVNDSTQLHGLVGDRSWLGPASRIIVTSRDKEVLNSCDEIYQVVELQGMDALQLFNMYAFKQNNYSKDYIEWVKKVIRYAQGVPLALKLLGSHLYGRPPKEWDIVLEKLKDSPHSEIQKTLELSYDDLDPEVKNIFLDIACFFKGNGRYYVKDILEKGCGYKNFSWGIMRLIDKCLLTIGLGDVLEMHDLIQEMGKEIAEREGSRLWNSKVICQMLRNNMGSEVVQGIHLDLSQTEKVCLHRKAFSRMMNLRLLKIYWPSWKKEQKNPVFMLESGKSNKLKCLPHMLSLLHWENYPYKSLPRKFFMENLVELNLEGGNITHLWDGDKCPQNLKRLDLTKCRQLMRLPNLSLATNLEEIDLFLCQNLVEIDTSIKCLLNLTYLHLYGCKKLKYLPEMPRSIKDIDLSETEVEEWSSSSIQFLDNLEFIIIKDCKNLTSLPINLQLNCYSDEGYTGFILKGCQNLEKLPEIAGNVENIDLSKTAIKELPSSIGFLSPFIVSLIVRDCENLRTVPDSICELKYLEQLDLCGCSKLEILPALYGLSSLEKLILDESAIEEIPSDIVSLSSLEVLSLTNCKRLQGLPKLPRELRQLRVKNCTSLKTAKLSLYTISTLLSYYHEFNYCNCVNLDENARFVILTDAFFLIEKIATAFNNARHKFQVSYQGCVPGSEIPESYGYQSEGSSVSIEFSPKRFNTMFIGFAFSVVLDFNSVSVLSSKLSFGCDCIFRSATDEKNSFFNKPMYRYDVPKSDHVFLWYDSDFDSGLNDWLIVNSCNVIEASFEFSVFMGTETYRRDLKVKKCGIELIYNKDVQKKWNEKRSAEINEEQPLPKRMKGDRAALLPSNFSYVEDDIYYSDETKDDFLLEEIYEDEGDNRTDSWDDELHLDDSELHLDDSELHLESEEIYEAEDEDNEADSWDDEIQSDDSELT